MQVLKSIWDFFQDEILGINWLNRWIGTVLNLLGLDISEKLGATVQFILYDIIKIMLLLAVLILIISYIQSYPPRKNKENPGKISWHLGKYSCRITRHCKSLCHYSILERKMNKSRLVQK